MIGMVNLIERYMYIDNPKRVDLSSLKLGQLIQGEIIELLSENQAHVLIKGQRVLARAEVPLIKGQTPLFMVTQVKDEIQLKLLTDSTNQNRPISSIQDILRSLDIRSNSQNQQTIMDMMRNEVPIQKEIFNLLSSLMREGMDSAKIFSALKTLNHKNLPINQVTMGAMLEFLNDDGIGGKLEQLYHSLVRQIQESTNLQRPLNSIKNETIALMNTQASQQHIVQESSVSTNKQGHQVGLNEHHMDNQGVLNGTSGESLVSGTKRGEIAGMNQQFSNQQPTNDSDNELFLRLSKQLVELLDSFKLTNNDFQNEKNARIAVPYQTEKVEISSNIVDSIRTLDISTIKSDVILPRIVHYFEQIGLKTKDESNQSIQLKESLEQLIAMKETLPKEMALTADKAIQHILGQQLMVKPDGGMFHFSILQIPNFLPFSEQPVFVQVHSKTKKNKEIDVNDLRLGFLFQLFNLGDTVVDLRIVDKQIFIQVFNNTSIAKGIFKELEPRFIRFIKEQGYQTTGITFLPLNKDVNKLKVPTEPMEKMGVDIKI